MAQNITNWIQAILYGYREILANGVPVVARSTLNIVGLTVLDDPVNKRTNVTFAGAYVPTDAPIADTVMSRNGSGGTSVTALSVYDTVPPTGVQTAYLNGAAGTAYADNGFSFSPATVTRVQPYLPIYFDTLWLPDASGRIVTLTNGASGVHFDLSVPDGAILTAVDIWIKPATSHGGLPGTMPTLNLSRVSAEDTGTSLLAGETDQSADVPTFEDPHTITLDVNSTAALAPTTVDNTQYFYRVKFTSEADANALLGCTVLGVMATYTTTTYRK